MAIDYADITSILLILGLTPFVLIGLYIYFYIDESKNKLKTTTKKV